MKIVITAAILSAAMSTGAFAQSQANSTTSNTMTPMATAPTMTAKYSVDTPIETLVADPKANAVLDADFPNMTKHPMYEQFKGMTLKQLQPMSQGKITDAQIAKANADFAAIK